MQQDEWYLPDPHGVTALGPFDTEYIIELIKTSKLRTDDFICSPTQSGERWERIYRFKQFNSFLPDHPICPPPRIFSKGIYSKIEAVKTSSISSSNQYFVSIDAEIVLHDNSRVINGRTLRLCETSVIVECYGEMAVNKGDQFYLTFYNCTTLPTFTCQVVLIDSRKEDDRMLYEFYFIRLNPINKNSIIHFLNKNAPQTKETEHQEKHNQ